MKEKKINLQKRITLIVSAAAVFGTLGYLFSKNVNVTLISSLVGASFGGLYFIINEKLKESIKIRKMEEIFPDFIELMASNLRSGMTIDKALLLSSRKEFSPLDEEINILGKDILTGKEITQAMKEMSERTKSEKIGKTTDIIISGIKSGGNLAVLLEQTAVNMREKGFVEKRAASNVLMYMIFILFSIAVGAPALFALSSVLVEILSSILTDLPATDASIQFPLALKEITISSSFITYFSITFLLVTSLLASMLIGLVRTGQEKDGLKYFIPLSLTSVAIFFLVRIPIKNYFSTFVS